MIFCPHMLGPLHNAQLEVTAHRLTHTAEWIPVLLFVTDSICIELGMEHH